MCGLRFLLASVLIAVPTVLSSGQPEVTIEQGVVRGLYRTTAGNKIFASFEGIPFAQPPEGKYRFKEPSPAKPWLGTYNATREPPKCLQSDFYPPFSANNTMGSEDCLYINVYTPKLPTGGAGDKPLDVLAFIHGGAFMMLYGAVHNPHWLLDRDIILVSFNYRLGVLGYLSTEDDIVPGNNGMKDQVLALKWIQKNIAFFGGNPNSVTIGGVSAGGASCHLHMISPLSKGLFKGAYCMSGVALNNWVITKNPRQNANILANELGCPTDDTKLMVKCLRNRPADDVVLATKIFSNELLPFALVFTPVIEPSSPGAFLSSKPDEIIQQKGAIDIPLWLSYASEEGLCMGADIVTNPESFNRFIAAWDHIIPAMIGLDSSVPAEKQLAIASKIKDYYKISNSTEGAKNLIRLLGDLSFELGIGMAAKLHSSIYNSPVYLEKFSYRGEHSLTELFTKEDLGVSHGDDFIYMFGPMMPGVSSLSTESDLQMSEKMIDLLVSFAANGALEENWEPVNKNLPKITYTDIRGPNEFKLIVANDIGEEMFWHSLMTTDSSLDEL